MWVIILFYVTFVLEPIFNVLVRDLHEDLREDLGSWTHVIICWLENYCPSECKWMEDECKVYMKSYMASNGSRFMVSWTIFKNHLLEVRLTQKPGDHGTLNPHTINLWYFVMCEDPTWIEIHRSSIWLRPGHTWLHTTLEGLVCWYITTHALNLKLTQILLSMLWLDESWRGALTEEKATIWTRWVTAHTLWYKPP